MSADLTAEHTRALRQAISDPGATTPRGDDYREHIVDWQLRALMAQPEALAASLPAEVMLAALVDRGALTEEWRVWFTGSGAPTAPVDEATSRRFAGDHRERRRVTPWEVAP